MLHPGASIDAATNHISRGTQPAKAPRLTRLVSGAQLLSTLLAVPLGLASGYSIYRANFAPETNCQNLRSSIIAMLDKNVDAATRHMLVRRDVETFERSCGAFDPDAKAAFKRLLAADRVQATAVRRAEAKPEAKAEAKPKDIGVKAAEPDMKATRRADAHPSPARLAPTPKTAPSAQAARTEHVEAAPPSDTAWIAAVRAALVTHGAGSSESKEPAAAKVLGAPPAPLSPLPAEAAVPAMAPVLPEAHEVVGPSPQPAVAQQQPVDHPVPPAPIGGPPEGAKPKLGAVGAIVDNIPFLGPVVDAVSAH